MQLGESQKETKFALPKVACSFHIQCSQAVTMPSDLFQSISPAHKAADIPVHESVPPVGDLFSNIFP